MEVQFHVGVRARALLITICGLFCNTGNLCSASRKDSVVNIGVLLNYNSYVGKVAKTAIEMAADDVNRDNQVLNGSQVVVEFRNTKGAGIQGASAALDLFEREVVAIIGPQEPEVAEFILHLGYAAQVPVVSFSVTSPLVSHHRFPYFFRMARSDALQMHPIAALIQAYGWRGVTAVYSDDEFGAGAVSSLSDALRSVGSELKYRSAISNTADQQAIGEELNKLMTMQSRVFVVHMQSDIGLKVFTEAHKIGMMDSGYVWITTDEFASLWDVMLNDSTMVSMQGLLGVKTYIRNSNRLEEFRRSFRRRFRDENPDEEKTRLNPYGLFAYDALWMIALAVGNLGNTSFNFLKPLITPPFGVEDTTDFTKLKVFQEGPELLQNLLETKFCGLSGNVQLQDGEMMGSTYEIANVVGKSYHVIGYWSNETQLSKQHPSFAASPSGQNNAIDKLGTAIWPGGSTEVPRGWVQPTTGKRLKIAVPMQHEFNQFVTIAFDSGSGQSKVTGFCRDVFDAVLSRLDYALPYDLIPYHVNSYDELVFQVYLKNFDAVVADTTILSNRSKYVDFTQPFTESGLVMVVPIKAGEANNVWTFIQPLPVAMWCTTGALFIFTGLVIWLLEHRENPEFRGRPRDQLMTLLWFLFSTLFTTHRENLVSSLSRLVLMIWLFVVLILKSSYTASLTSMLTVQKLNPTVKNVETLRDSGVAVGYQNGSFVADYLHKEFGIAKENIRTYSTPEEAGYALSKGPNNGGVAAIFDEIPYIRVFLASQCGYTMVGPIYKTGGLGFAFSKGSPLVSDISRAVLSLSEDKEMQEIQDKWFNITACTDSGAKVHTHRLSIDSFWGLYLITGTASLTALIIFFSLLLYDYRRDLNVKANNNSEMDDPSSRKASKSLSTAVQLFIEYVDQKESSTSGPKARVSEVSVGNSGYSRPGFKSSPSDLQTNSFRTSTLSRRSFCFLNHEHKHVAGANENSTAQLSSVSSLDQITEHIPPNEP